MVPFLQAAREEGNDRWRWRDPTGHQGRENEQRTVKTQRLMHWKSSHTATPGQLEPGVLLQVYQTTVLCIRRNTWDMLEPR